MSAPDARSRTPGRPAVRSGPWRDRWQVTAGRGCGLDSAPFPALRIAAGISVIPAAGVESLALEGLDPGNARQFGDVKRPGADPDIFKYLIKMARRHQYDIKRVL